VLRRRMTAEGVATFGAKLPAYVIAMETRCGSHYLGRTSASLSRRARVVLPESVLQHVKVQKTDDRDAEAIAEVATRATIRLVTVKTEAQLDL